MQKWQQDIVELLHGLVDEVENFFTDMNEIIDTLFEFTQEWDEPIETTEASEIFDAEINSFIGNFTEAYEPVEGILLEDFDPAFPYPVDATSDRNPACIGCHHYHGYAYGGNLLVCGMHPEGWQDGTCPDWEAENIFEGKYANGNTDGFDQNPFT